MFLGPHWSLPSSPAAAAGCRTDTSGPADLLPHTSGAPAPVPVASAAFSADPGSGILMASGELPSRAPGTWLTRESGQTWLLLNE